MLETSVSWKDWAKPQFREYHLQPFVNSGRVLKVVQYERLKGCGIIHAITFQCYTIAKRVSQWPEESR